MKTRYIKEIKKLLKLYEEKEKLEEEIEKLNNKRKILEGKQSIITYTIMGLLLSGWVIGTILIVGEYNPPMGWYFVGVSFGIMVTLILIGFNNDMEEEIEEIQYEIDKLESKLAKMVEELDEP